MTYFCDATTIIGPSAAADDLPAEVREHILAYARMRGYGSEVWLDAVWSEGDPDLEELLEEALGRTEPAGYMSEECGWDVTWYVTVD